MTTNSVYLTKQFQHSSSLVFKAFTTPEYVMQWFGPINTKMVNAVMTFEVGGTYAFELERPDGSTFSIKGEYTVIEPPYRLEFTVSYEGLPAAIAKPSVVTIVLEALEEGTELRFQQAFTTLPANMEGRTKSWELMFERLGQLEL